MSIHDEDDLKGIEEASQVAKLLREVLKTHCRVGVTTRELDELCRREMRALGAVSAPRADYQAPCFAFYSVNQCVVHGLPTDNALVDGDLVKIDVTPRYRGFIADTACTVVVGASAQPVAHRLIEGVEAAFRQALGQCRVGALVNRIGQAIEGTTRSHGFFVVPDLSGHGVGRGIHEEPSVFNTFQSHQKDRLTEGLVVAIEPMIVNRKSGIRTKKDGWSIVTEAGSLTAHHEHTVLITRTGPVVLTA